MFYFIIIYYLSNIAPALIYYYLLHRSLDMSVSCIIPEVMEDEEF